MVHDEDLVRLPVGMKRIGYDADTARYTFRDEEGNIYIGPPNQAYGSLTLVDSSEPPSDRPNAFASGSHLETETLQQPLSMFHEILPASAITSVSSSESPVDTPKPPRSSSSRFSDAMRTTQNVVKNVRRSVTKRTRQRESRSAFQRVERYITINARGGHGA
ncbi:hypothetical protein C8R43DRAFT_1244612 [Mycena crocata]|nr:hypothetical protein C8R43DRAFT_1244612 [Mycena crocata]